jgi:hypothetical protein
MQDILETDRRLAAGFVDLMCHTARYSAVVVSYWHVGPGTYVSDPTTSVITVEDLLPCITRGPKPVLQQSHRLSI